MSLMATEYLIVHFHCLSVYASAIASHFPAAMGLSVIRPWVLVLAASAAKAISHLTPPAWTGTTSPPWSQPTTVGYNFQTTKVYTIYPPQFNPDVICSTSLSWLAPGQEQPSPTCLPYADIFGGPPAGFRCKEWEQPTPTSTASSAQAASVTPPPVQWPQPSIFYAQGLKPVTVFPSIFDPKWVCRTSLSWVSSPDCQPKPTHYAWDRTSPYSSSFYCHTYDPPPPSAPRSISFPCEASTLVFTSQCATPLTVYASSLDPNSVCSTSLSWLTPGQVQPTASWFWRDSPNGPLFHCSSWDSGIAPYYPTPPPTFSISLDPRPVATKLPNQEQECLKSWDDFYHLNPHLITSLRMDLGPSIPRIQRPEDSLIFTHEVDYVIALIESFGPSSTYVRCDNITRISWLGPRNTTTTRWVTKQITATDSRPHTRKILPHNRAILITTTQSTLGTQPTCTLALDTCNRLYEAYEGVETGDVKLLADTDAPVLDRIIQHACAQWKDCSMQTGQELVLLYWPERVSQDVCALNGYGTVQALPLPTRPFKSLNFTPNITLTAITFRGKDIYGPYVTDIYPPPIDYLKKRFIGPSVMYGNWTLFSPTVYIAHHPITLSITQRNLLSVDHNSIEHAYSNAVLASGILPLRPEDVSSVYSVVDGEPTGLEWVSSVINGRYLNHEMREGNFNFTHITTQLNFNHLADPVPASIYFKARWDCRGNVTHCSTITDDSHRPKLYINRAVWQQAMPSGLRCRLPPFVDPASALSAVDLYAPEEPEIQLPKLGAFPAAKPTPEPGRGPNGLQHIGARPGGRGGLAHPRPTGQPPKPGGGWGLGGGSADPRAGRGKHYGEASLGGAADWNHRPGYGIDPSSDYRPTKDGGRKGWLGGGRNDGWHRSDRHGSVPGGSGETGDGRGPGMNGGRNPVRGGGNGESAGATGGRNGLLFTGGAARYVSPHGGLWISMLFGGLWVLFG